MSRTWKDKPEQQFNSQDAKRLGLLRYWSYYSDQWLFWWPNYNYDGRPPRCKIRKTRCKPCTCRVEAYCGCNDLVRAVKIDWGFRGKRWIRFRYSVYVAW